MQHVYFSDVQKTGKTDSVEKPNFKKQTWHRLCGSGCTQKVNEQQCDSFREGGSHIIATLARPFQASNLEPCAMPPRKQSGPTVDGAIYLFIEAQSTAQGHHLRTFHNFKSRTSWIHYNTCTWHQRKTYKHNPKVSPFGIALVKTEKKGK